MRSNERAGIAPLLSGSIALLLVGLALTGCNNNNSGSGSPPISGPSNPASGSAGKHIAVISPAKSSPFHVNLVQGAHDRAKALGWPEIIDKAPGP